MAIFFISYRTGDESFAAVMLDHRLSARFGTGAVFRDSRSIPPGTDFEPVLWRTLGRSSVLVVVIGPRWLTGTGEVNRLHSPEDFVRREIAFALQLGLPVVPVLVGGAAMPDRRDLPEELRPIVGTQYRRIHARTEEADMNRLVNDLADQFGEPNPNPPGSVALIGGADDESVRSSTVDAGISGAVVSRSGALVRIDQPGADRAVTVAGDFLRALTEHVNGAPVRVALHYDEPVATRLLDEPVLQAVLAATSGARVVVLTTEAFHRVAVAPGHPSIDKASFSHVRLTDGSTGWVHVPGYPAPRGVPSFQPDPAPDRETVRQSLQNFTATNVVQAGAIYGDQVFGDKVAGPKSETHHHHGRAE